MIVAGFGFRQAATLASLQEALAGVTPGLIATAAAKAGHPAFRALAEALAVPAVAVADDDLRQADTRTESAASRAAHGAGSVAEAAALVAAGPGASLLGPRAVSRDRMATCALAERTTP
ncbi:cobalamin biosynthesis protein [Tabrizicola sp. J26]|uniref:cobalamin biosynthesis protein n=1 Tax=Alitabrizicola rongguiensis TaxID=2909234 RepID=UPI001F4706FF|nr:cobalamin biosynthesis protein [Tabrizicola rongguiensis]MCF1710205.1 cobalamin biosynthesis protein [Tabrizicola rongguiensis]